MATLDEAMRRRILELVFRRLPRDQWDVILFGSFARGTAGRGSDIDLAVRGPGRLDRAVAARLVADLEDGVPTLREFDVVDLRAAPEALRAAVAREGIEWNRARTPG